MQGVLEWINNAVEVVNSYLADYVLIVLLVGVGLFFTIKTRFVQVRCFGQGFKNIFNKSTTNGKKEKGGMTSFQAFTTAVAGQVGTGNIVGASAAVLIGGPGAIFWMWIIAFFGMATIYSEAVLAIKTRQINPDGSIDGGPVYYIKRAFKGKFGKFLAGFFAFALVFALGFSGSMVQSNKIGATMNEATGVPTWVVGLVVCVLAFFVFIGGVKRLASVTEKLVPIMAILYIVCGLVIISLRITVVPEAFAMIFRFAFTPNAIIGGGVASAIKMAISMGAKRGLFSNEAGMGSTPHAHAQAIGKTPHEQGTIAMIGVFIDTFIVLTITALILVITLYAGNGNVYAISQQALKEGVDVQTALEGAGYSDSTMLSLGISSLFNSANVGLKIGSIFVAVCMFFFAFSTIISWHLFGKLNFTYLFGKKSAIVYSLIAVVLIFLGSILESSLVWGLTDLFNYLMVIPNAIALFALYKMVVEEVKANDKKRSYKKTPNQALKNTIEN